MEDRVGEGSEGWRGDGRKKRRRGERAEGGFWIYTGMHGNDCT